MSKIMYKGRSYANAGVSSDATSIPTADMTASFDSSAHMNSEDMTATEVSNFVDGLDAEGAPSEYRKLLWTNTQGGQSSYTITANFSEYDEIEVVFDRNGDLITKRMGNSGSATFRIVWANYIVERTATISSNTMTIGNGGFYGSYNSGTLSEGSTYAVPTKIYGIKYERVAPLQVDASDYVVEQDISGIWTYRKWASGIAECWGYYSKSISANTDDSNNYITYPFPFMTTPITTLGLRAGGADLYRGHITDAGDTSNTQLRLTLCNRHTSAVTFGLNIHCIGRWK